MNFREAESEYQQIKAQFDGGEVTAEHFEAAASRIVVWRGGVRWRIGVMTGRWYRETDGRWEQANPYAASTWVQEVIPPGSVARLVSSGLMALVFILIIYLFIFIAAILDRQFVSAMPFIDQPTLRPGVRLYEPLATVQLESLLSPTPTAEKSETPTVEPTPTATSTATPTPKSRLLAAAPGGPWLFASNQEAAWGIAPESGTVQEYETGSLVKPLHFSPTGKLAAYLSGDPSTGYKDLALKVIQIPEGDEVATITLLPDSPDGRDFLPQDLQEWFEYFSLAWSPDGLLLAFTGMIDGPTLDLYLWSTETMRIERLDELPSLAYSPNWSPDGLWMVFFGRNLAEGMTASSTDNADNLTGYAGAWAVELNSRVVYDLGSGGGQGESIAGWEAPHTIGLFQRDEICGGTGLRFVNLEEVGGSFPDFGQVAARGCFRDAATDGQDGNVLIVVDSQMASNCPCSADLHSPGIYYLPRGLGLPQQIRQGDFTRVEWMQEAGKFLVGDDERWYTAIRPDGSLEQLPAGGFGGLPVISAIGNIYAWIESDGDSRDGVWLWWQGREPQQIYSGQVSDLDWTPTGQALVFASEQDLLRSDGPHFQPAINASMGEVVEAIQWAGP